MYKTIFASLAIALTGAAFITFSPAMTDRVEAGTPQNAAPIIAKSDRLDARPIGRQCSDRAWPYFEAGCLRGQTLNAKPAAVRVVSADRVPG